MKKLVVVLFLSLFFIIFPKTVRAEVIHSFDTQIMAHKNGVLDVTETINYDFQYGDRHGIFRYIPRYSEVGNLYRIIDINNINVQRDGQNENFTTTTNNEQVYLKIGNADRTITGDHIYKISYTVENAVGSNFEDHDEIYWNATGNDWQTFIAKATASVSTDFNAKQTNFLCFQGIAGAKDTACKVSANSAASSRTLATGEGLTVVAVYPVNTFPKTVLSRTPPKSFAEKVFGFILSNYFYIFIFLNFGVGGYVMYWYLRHKNKKRFGAVSVNFEIPEDEKGNRLAPALAGTIDTARIERNDVTATLFDLAIRKYIKLSGVKKVRKLMPDTTEQTITKLKEDDGGLEDFEKVLFDRLFEAGDSINLSDLRLDFYLTYEDMENKIFSTLVKKKYYTKNPKAQKAGLLFLSFLSFFTFNIFLAGVFFYLSKNLNGRTSVGDEIDFRIDGLKLFLKSMDRNYNWQAEKFFTVEQMIPYAMALGYIDKFMEQLKIINPDYNPSWYSGGNFYTNYALFYAATSSNLTTSAPSSSSGSGGGGFSGGGGGGGGGGSW